MRLLVLLRPSGHPRGEGKRPWGAGTGPWLQALQGGAPAPEDLDLFVLQSEH